MCFKLKTTKMKKLYYIFVLIIMSTTIHAQQNMMLNHYIFNHMAMNPAYAGTKQWVNMNLTASAQWLNFPGAPSTQVFSIEGPASEQVGLGLLLVNDRIGAQTQQAVYGNYSYILKINDKWKLSMGLAGGLSYFALDGTLLVSDDIDDPSIPLGRENTYRFDPRAGLFLYSDRFYAGISVTDMLGDMLNFRNSLVTDQARHYYLTAGYVFDAGNSVKIKPSFLIREDFKALTTIDLNTFVLFEETFWIGATLRFGADLFTSSSLENALQRRNAIVIMTEWNISRNMMIGYAYTHSITALNGYSGHEIVLGYTLPKRTSTPMLSPRYF